MRFSPATAAFSGFQLVAQKPAAFIAWCLLYVGFLAVVCGLMFATMFPVFIATATNNQAAISKAVTDNPLMFVVLVLVLIPMVAVYAAMMTGAIYRAIVSPERGGFGYIRLGEDEFRLIGLYLLLILMWIGVIFVATLVFVAIGAAFAAMGPKGAGWSFLVFFVLGLALLCAYVFVGIRLSLCAAQTFAERRITIFGSWKLTRNHFGSLFVMGLILFAVVLGMALLNLTVQTVVKIAGGSIAQVAQSGGTPTSWAAFGIYMVFAVAFATLQTVVTTAPAAAAYRMLSPNRSAADVFS